MMGELCKLYCVTQTYRCFRGLKNNMLTSRPVFLNKFGKRHSARAVKKCSVFYDKLRNAISGMKLYCASTDQCSQFIRVGEILIKTDRMVYFKLTKNSHTLQSTIGKENAIFKQTVPVSTNMARLVNIPELVQEHCITIVSQNPWTMLSWEPIEWYSNKLALEPNNWKCHWARRINLELSSSLDDMLVYIPENYWQEANTEESPCMEVRSFCAQQKHQI